MTRSTSGVWVVARGRVERIKHISGGVRGNSGKASQSQCADDASTSSAMPTMHTMPDACHSRIKS